jgi:hypothetical protein
VHDDVSGLDVVSEAVTSSVPITTLEQLHKLPLPIAVGRRGLLLELVGEPQFLVFTLHSLKVKFEGMVVQ